MYEKNTIMSLIDDLLLQTAPGARYHGFEAHYNRLLMPISNLKVQYNLILTA